MRIVIQHNSRRFIEALARAPGVVMFDVDLAVQRSAIELGRTASRGAPKALSTLVNSIKNRRVGLARHNVEAGVSYAVHVEEGTGPGGSPPIDALRRWIRQRGMNSRVGADERGLAFLIQRKIRQRGTPAQPFMGPALESSRARFALLWRTAALRGMQRALA